jgi:vanillate/4-hydroxybenzoate decarboxylase subunit C
MPFGSLRDFLEYAEEHGQLLRIKEEVRPEPDIRTIACAATKSQAGPVVLFEKIQGYKDKKIVMNVHGSWANHALTLEMPKHTPVKEQFHEILRRWDRYPLKPKRASSAPVKEVILTKNFSLFRELPLFRVNPMDGGFYLSKACVVARDPEDFNNQNVGIYRIQVKDHDRLGIQISAQHDLAAYLRKAEEMNQPVRVAIAIGNDPITPFVAASPLKYDEDEYSMMGAIRGAPMEVICSERGDLDVPAGAELVIEGEIVPRQRFVEGPFAEYPGSYSTSMLQAEVKVDAITRRRDPIIFENLYTGEPWTEIDYLQGLNTCATIYKQMKADFPEVQAVNALYTHGYATIISSKMRFGGFAKTLGCRLLSTPHGITYPKLIIIVDEEVDPFDLKQVMWAMTVRFRPERDLVLIPNAPSSTLDPAHLVRGLATKVIIDAAKPAYPDIPLSDADSVEVPAKTAFWIDEIEKRMRVAR